MWADAIARTAALIEFGGALVVALAAIRALLTLVRGHSIERARLVLIGGALGALGFKTAATLLKAIELGTWNAVGLFASVLALRTLVKQLLTWERKHLLGRVPARSARP